MAKAAKPLTPKQEVNALVQDGRLFVDRVTHRKAFEHYGDVVEFRSSYFYRNGMTPEGRAAKVLAALGPTWEIVPDLCRDEWRAWPKTSYMVAVLRKKACTSPSV